MKAVLADFNQNVREVDIFFSVLETLNDPDLVFSFQGKSKRPQRKVDPEWMKILKAASFLILYNLIESSIKAAFGELYKQIQTEGLTGKQLKDEFLKIWIDQKFCVLDNKTSNADSYQRKATEMIDSIIAEKIMEFDPEKLAISGNLDAKKIRELCEKHGITLKIHKAAKGGANIRTVKDNRNDLGHGGISFSECGRQYSVENLQDLRKEVIIYTRSFLNNISRYALKKDYVAA